MNRAKGIAVAFVVTALIAGGMFTIGMSAFFNPTSVAASNTPAEAGAPTAGSASDVQQLQNLVRQYQEREKQYQSQLDQADALIQQYQSVLSQLQQRGLIRIMSDGTIQLRGR
ncbi:MAG: hypothetical protein HYR71_12500 [Chloroflexi bacterium]|nr:hypothetical protein [Chloroflexota bacterium]